RDKQYQQQRCNQHHNDVVRDQRNAADLEPLMVHHMLKRICVCQNRRDHLYCFSLFFIQRRNTTVSTWIMTAYAIASHTSKTTACCSALQPIIAATRRVNRNRTP